MTERVQILSDCAAMVARWDRAAFGRGPEPLPAERSLVPYRQRMIYLGTRPGPVSPLIPGTVRVREVYHLWVSDLALRKLRTVEA